MCVCVVIHSLVHVDRCDTKFGDDLDAHEVYTASQH